MSGEPKVSQDAGESRLMKRLKSDPATCIGIAGWFGIVAYGIYGIKNRKMKLSNHLIHTRMYAQAFVLGAIAVGVTYRLIKEDLLPLILPKESKEEK